MAPLVTLLVALATMSLQVSTLATTDADSQGEDDVQEHDAFLEEFPNRAEAGDWIDPTDLLNYDPATRTMKNRKVKNDGRTQIEDCRLDVIQCRQNLADFHDRTLTNKFENRDEHSAYRKELESCKENLSDCRVGYSNMATPAPDGLTTDSPCQLEQMFFRRFAKRFVGLLIPEHLKEPPRQEATESPLAAEVRVQLSDYNWNKLRQFVQQKGVVKLVDAHDLMADMLVSVQHDDEAVGGWLERWTGPEAGHLQNYVLTVIVCIVFVMFEARTKSTWVQQVCAVAAVTFFASIVWNWLSLYKKEVSRRFAELQKLGYDVVPANCRPDTMTWWGSLQEVIRSQLTFKDDPCQAFHDKYLVDPIYEVPPTRALSFTISTLFMEPLKHLGKYLGDFHRELLRDLPYVAWVPALMTCYLLLIIPIVLVCYCPQRRGRRDLVGLERLEGQLRERNERIAQLENAQRENIANLPQPPALPPVGRPQRDVPCIRCQRNDDQYADASHPQERSSSRRKHRSQPELQQPHRYAGGYGPRNASYPSDDSDDSDDRRLLRGRSAGYQASPQRPLGELSRRHDESRYCRSLSRSTSQTTMLRGQPVDCPLSEVDSLNSVSSEAKVCRSPPSASEMEAALPGISLDHGRIPEASARLTTSSGMTDVPPGPGGSGDGQEPITDPTALDSFPGPDDPVAAVSKRGCDSPSSVSVIEGDSSPASGASIDGDSHLRGLGLSLSGSIDVIDPVGAAGGVVESDGEQDSDEFEVLSREQCL